MRVISGIYKGKQIDGFDIDGTRPTMDRIKESMFAMIQDYIKDSICLDLFAGSGSLGIEAISNGAKETYFVDNGNEVLKILKKNLKDIKEDYKVLELDYNKALKYFKDNNIKFDLIILDPPYHRLFINKILNYIVDNNILNNNGIIVCEYEEEKVDNDRLKLLKEKKYGSKNVRVYAFDSEKLHML